MKVYISKYRHHWVSPYSLLEKIYFWREIDYDEPFIKKMNAILNPFFAAAQKFLDFVHPKIDYVKIDRWDTWSMDSTLSIIILPMLKQLKDTKHGAPFTSDDDVPEELKSTSAPPKENEWDTDDNHFKRWDYVLNEMIWAFEQKVKDDWEQQFYKFEDDPKAPLGMKIVWRDDEGRKKHQERMSNGFRLFGKYYEGLWD